MKMTFELAKPIAAKYKLREDDVTWAIEATIEHLQGHAKWIGARRKRTQKDAVELLEEWLEKGDEWAVDTSNLQDIASFVRSHAPGCVWAVLQAKIRCCKMIERGLMV